MASLVGVVFCLACLVMGIRGLLEGNTSIGLGSRSGGGSGLFSVTLTGKRCILFSLITIVTGLVIGGVWIASYPHADQSTLEDMMWSVGAVSAFTLFGIGVVCALWEIAVTAKPPPTEKDK
jgi:hypothetical protein